MAHENYKLYKHINPDEITDLTNDFLDSSKCPFTNAMKYLNTLGGIMSSDTTSKIKKSIMEVFSKAHGKQDFSVDVESVIDVELTIRNEAKVKKHIYDVLLLQSEVYNEIKNILSIESGLFKGLVQLSSQLDLQELEQRKDWGLLFFEAFLHPINDALRLWELRKVKDSKEYRDAFQYALQHSNLSKRTKSVGFSVMFIQGVTDGFQNFWSLVCNIPELYEAQWGRQPTAVEYRELVRKNIKKVIFPLASLTMPTLISVIRAERPTSMSKEFINNAFDLNPQDFELDEEGHIHSNLSYNKKISIKMARLMISYWEGQKAHLKANQSELLSKSDFPIRVGCPALSAKTEDGTVVVEQFCEDILTLLDTIYFPYWDKIEA